MIKIRVPGTSANLGPGYDVLGLAIDRYNTYTFIQSEDVDEGNLIYIAYKRVFEYLDKEIIPVRIEVDENIPRARGLGSSAACIVGGIMGANEVLGNPLDKEDILKLATEIEGHPDNVAPAIYGGLVASVVEGEEIYTGKIAIKNNLEFIALVPDFELSTAKARGVLPDKIDHADGVFNVGRTTMLLTALISGNNSLIKLGLEDKFHQPYRGDLIKGYDEIYKNSYDLGALGCYLSGAGPTIMSIGGEGDKDFLEKIGNYMSENHPGWRVYPHRIDNQGARLV